MANINENRKLMVEQMKSVRAQLLNESLGLSGRGIEKLQIQLSKILGSEINVKTESGGSARMAHIFSVPGGIQSLYVDEAFDGVWNVYTQKENGFVDKSFDNELEEEDDAIKDALKLAKKEKSKLIKVNPKFKGKSSNKSSKPKKQFLKPKKDIGPKVIDAINTNIRRLTKENAEQMFPFLKKGIAAALKMKFKVHPEIGDNPKETHSDYWRFKSPAEIQKAIDKTNKGFKELNSLVEKAEKKVSGAAIKRITDLWQDMMVDSGSDGYVAGQILGSGTKSSSFIA